MYLIFHENSKPQHVVSIRELRTVLSHVIAIKASKGGTKVTTDSSIAQPTNEKPVDMDTDKNQSIFLAR